MKFRQTSSAIIAIATEDGEGDTMVKAGEEMGRMSKKTSKFTGMTACLLPLHKEWLKWNSAQPVNKLTLTIDLLFSDGVQKKDYQAIAQNVLDSLVHTTNTAGIVPDDAEYFTTQITVSDKENNVTPLNTILYGEK